MNEINLNKKCCLNDESIIAFQIYGGGGNRRNVEVLGELDLKDFSDLLTIEDDMVYDNAGNELISREEFDSGVGVLSFDRDYDTVYTVKAKDIDIHGDDGRALRNSVGDRFIKEQIVLYLCHGESEQKINSILAELDYEREQ